MSLRLVPRLLAESVAVSPSAIARRLRRLRADGWIRRTIALLSVKLTERRLRALVFITLSEHADRKGKAALDRRLNSEPAVSFRYDTHFVRREVKFEPFIRLS
jgi:Lrp/AsnC family leucine-responsive transcriptional regulator